MTCPARLARKIKGIESRSVILGTYFDNKSEFYIFFSSRDTSKHLVSGVVHWLQKRQRQTKLKQNESKISDSGA